MAIIALVGVGTVGWHVYTYVWLGFYYYESAGDHPSGN